MKAHIGVDVGSGLVHTLTGTAANEADITPMAAPLQGEEEAVFADAGYTGADKRPEHEDGGVAWNIAIKRGIIKALPKGLREMAESVERALAQLRAPVEHSFHIVKTCSDIRRCATAASTRTRHSSTPCSPRLTW
jgi:IS5 family transposase